MVTKALAEDVKAAISNGTNMSVEDVRSICENFLTVILDKVKGGEEVTLTNFLKIKRVLNKERTFNIPKSDVTKTKPERYGLSVKVMAGTKAAFEAIPVSNEANDSETEEPEPPKPAPKGKGKAKAPVPKSDSDSEEPKPAPKGKGKGKAKAPVPKSDSDSEEPEPPKPPAPKGKGKAKGKAKTESETEAEPEEPVRKQTKPKATKAKKTKSDDEDVLEREDTNMNGWTFDEQIKTSPINSKKQQKKKKKI